MHHDDYHYNEDMDYNLMQMMSAAFVNDHTDDFLVLGLVLMIVSDPYLNP
jgi:hypothetical protein